MLQVTSPAFPSAPAWVLATARLLFTLLSVADPTRGLLASAPGQLTVTLRVHLSGRRDPRLGLLAAPPVAESTPGLPQRPWRRVGTAWAFSMNCSRGRCPPQWPAWDCPPAPPVPSSGGSSPLAWVLLCGKICVSELHWVSQGTISH